MPWSTSHFSFYRPDDSFEDRAYQNLMLNALLGSHVTRKLRTVYHPMQGNPDSGIRQILDHYIFPGNYPPTPPLSQH